MLQCCASPSKRYIQQKSTAHTSVYAAEPIKRRRHVTYCSHVTTDNGNWLSERRLVSRVAFQVADGLLASSLAITAVATTGRCRTKLIWRLIQFRGASSVYGRICTQSALCELSAALTLLTWCASNGRF